MEGRGGHSEFLPSGTGPQGHIKSGRGHQGKGQPAGANAQVTKQAPPSLTHSRSFTNPCVFPRILCPSAMFSIPLPAALPICQYFLLSASPPFVHLPPLTHQTTYRLKFHDPSPLLIHPTFLPTPNLSSIHSPSCIDQISYPSTNFFSLHKTSVTAICSKHLPAPPSMNESLYWPTPSSSDSLCPCTVLVYHPNSSFHSLILQPPDNFPKHWSTPSSLSSFSPQSFYPSPNQPSIHQNLQLLCIFSTPLP